MYRAKTIFWNVFSKLSFLLICTIVLVVAMVIIQTLRFYTIRLDKDNITILHNYSKDITEHINAVNTVPKLLSTHPTLLTEELENQQMILKRHYESTNGSLESIYLISLEGTMLASWPEGKHALYSDNWIKTLDLSKNYNFVRLGAKDCIVVPAIHPNSSDVAGYLVAVLNYSNGLIMASIQSYASEIMNVFVMDENAYILAHNKQEYIGDSLPDLQAILNNGNSNLTLKEILSKQQSEIQVLEYTFDGVLRRGLFLYNSEFDIYLGTSRIKVKTTDIIFDIWQAYGMLLIVSLFFLMMLSLILTRSIISPIQRLERHANTMAEKHYVTPFHAASESRELKSLRIAIESIIDSLDEAYFTVISSLTKAMEEKDEYTQGHAQRVTELALEIGKELGLFPEDQLNLQYAAILHDIGKLAISDSILLKPIKLTQTECDIICRHPLISEAIASKSPFLSKALPGIRHHHERYDGSGYPDGLTGEEIPFLARTIAVADTFDAMTTNRPYRSAKSIEEAMIEIEWCSGTQFDPIVVSAFMRVMECRYIKSLQVSNS